MSPVVKFSNFNSDVSLSNLRKIANHIGTFANSTDIIEFLEERGVPKEQIQTDESPSRLTYHVFKHLVLSPNKQDHKTLKKLIVESINPALYEQSNQKETDILALYNEWLESESKKIKFREGKGYWITLILPFNSTLNDIDSQENKFQESVLDSIVSNYRKNIAEITLTYKLLIQIVELFSQKIYPVDEQLNDYYIDLFDRVENEIEYIHSEIIEGFKKLKKEDPIDYEYHTNAIQPYIYKTSEGRDILFKPFTNLRLAEDELKKRHETWEEVKRKMSVCFGFIEKTYHHLGADTIANLPHQDFFDKVTLSLERFHDNKNMLFFGFTDKTFFLERIEGGRANINFHPREEESSGPFYLMEALVEYLKAHGRKNNGWLETDVPRSELIEAVKKKATRAETIDSAWIRFTKGNLVKKIPEEFKVLITFSDFRPKTKDYHFTLKLPI